MKLVHAAACRIRAQRPESAALFSQKRCDSKSCPQESAPIFRLFCIFGGVVFLRNLQQILGFAFCHLAQRFLAIAIFSDDKDRFFGMLSIGVLQRRLFGSKPKAQGVSQQPRKPPLGLVTLVFY